MSTKAQRLTHVDGMRGLAVVCMFWMHSGDAWLTAELHESGRFDLVSAIGGLAAPVFLLVSGISLGMTRARARLAGLPGLGRATYCRGLQLIVLGYLMRVQMWLVDGDGYFHGLAWAAGVPLAAAYLAALAALSRLASPCASPIEQRRARQLATLAGLVVVACLAVLALGFPAQVETLLRQDILQTIGVSIILVTALSSVRPEPSAALAAGVACAALTHALADLLPGELPRWLASYLVHWDRGAQGAPVGLFPWFPWASYAFVGYALGTAWGSLTAAQAELSALRYCALGGAVALASCELLPHIGALFELSSAFVQPVRVAYRIGVGLMFGGLAVLSLRGGALARSTVLTLGRASLLVYWLHLWLTYGAFGRPLQGRLSLAEWGIGLLVLTGLMVGCARLWRRLRSRFGTGQIPAASALFRTVRPRLTPGARS